MITRIFRGERMLLTAIAKAAGMHRKTIERAASRAEDVTDQIDHLKRLRDMRLVAASHGVPRVLTRMRIHRGWPIDKALTTPAGRKEKAA